MVRYNGLVWSNIAVSFFYHPIYLIIDSKENDADPNNLYCFGTGDIDSVCTAEGSPGPEAPTGAPVAGGQNKNSEESVPSGEYYFNKLPGTVTRAVLCGETIR